MLLPSALPCDVRKYSTPSRFAPSRLFSPTPPPSDESFPSGNGLLGTCRALQSLLNVSPAPSPRRTKPERLQSPLQMKPAPKTRPQKIVKPEPKPPRGINKRRRECYEDSDTEMVDRSPNREFSTPKRRRCAPFDLPLGLASSDFYSLEPATIRASSPCGQIPQSEFHDHTADPDSAIPSIEVSDCSSNPNPNPNPNPDWTAEDDRRLVELVLEKFQLSKRDWDECARRMGKDNDSVGRRWQALVGEGNVGLRRGRRMVRRPIDESWR